MFLAGLVGLIVVRACVFGVHDQQVLARVAFERRLVEFRAATLSTMLSNVNCPSDVCTLCSNAAPMVLPTGFTPPHKTLMCLALLCFPLLCLALRCLALLRFVLLCLAWLLFAWLIHAHTNYQVFVPCLRNYSNTKLRKYANTQN